METQTLTGEHPWVSMVVGSLALGPSSGLKPALPDPCHCTLDPGKPPHQGPLSNHHPQLLLHEPLPPYWLVLISIGISSLSYHLLLVPYHPLPLTTSSPLPFKVES